MMYSKYVNQSFYFMLRLGRVNFYIDEEMLLIRV